jgi:heme exporter protein A
LPADSQLAVSAAKVSKSFGRTVALREADLELAWGESLVLFGHNGAGKSTLLRILASLARPDSGTISVAGFQPPRQNAQARETIGFLGHQTLLYNDFTTWENLRFYGRLYHVPDLDERITQVLHELGIEPMAGRRVGTLSNGMQKRVAMARAILHRPSLLLLDEPETGLDPEGASLLWALLRAVLKGGASVIMTTHDISQGLAFSDEVAVLRRGRMALRAPAANVNAAAIQEILVSAVEEGVAP